LEGLTLVGDVELEDDAYRYSKHARPILENVRRCGELDGALRDADLAEATSGVTNVNEKKRERNPLTPRQLAERLEDYEGNVALVFGPEDDGLRKEEFSACDLVVTIPSHPDYPILNLSHSAAVIFYELRGAWRPAGVRPRSAGGEERELLMEKFRLLLDSVTYPEHKKEKTEVLFRRVMGRATLSKWEFHTLMGVFDRAIKRMDPGSTGDFGEPPHLEEGGEGP
jgi:TrmH family RNA methyltransferase